VPCFYYPEWGILPHEARLPHVDAVSERLETLSALSSHGQGPPAPAVVVTSVVALMQRTFAPEALAPRVRHLHCGDALDPLDLVEWLEDQAYEPEAQVTHKGELAMRGGIVDVFPLTSPWPVRLEFFGNTLESLRFFDPATQVSREETASVCLSPAGEIGILQRLLRETQAAEARSEEAAPARSAAPSICRALGTLADHLPRRSVVVLCEPERLAERAGDYARQVPAGDPFFVRWDMVLAQMTAAGAHQVRLRELGAEVVAAAVDPLVPDEASHDPEPALALGFASLEVFRPLAARASEPMVAEAQRREFFGQLHRWQRQGYRVHLFCNNEGERQRFGEIWQEYGLAAPAASGPVAAETTGSPAADSGLCTHLGTLSGGFVCETAGIVVVTDAEVFGRYKVPRHRRLKSPHAAATGSTLDLNFTELEEGDHVVHLQHGIGRYLGLHRLQPPPRRAGDTTDAPVTAEECLVIEYAPRQTGQPPPRLHVPLTQAHLVSKYVGASKGRPPLNTLGGTRWLRAKAEAAAAVRDLAADLLNVQAARASRPGFAFPVDAPWQREFESAFVYEETPDQWRAIQDTKGDMEQAKPMDRLVCGDAGFGKTEVAIRAAFKAVLAGKQVAVLVPTTVLAQQHFNTFRERMADYPVRIELLSRFRTRGQQQGVLRELGAGAVDIVIGTHRLVQEDVVFKDLGLAVIDEEQRFGVAHKEKLKQLRRLVDVLTLTATPIPRTLYLALTGARDLSKIETPPQDRLPIETIIAPYDERLIRDAIQRELNRGGQVFYLHNRVYDIESVALRLRGLVPQARIEVGHGQMPADDLERIMTRFVNDEVDVLLSTTIIESGIDIPNANTIIIDRPDRFGLSDLYQLRGRVGRYKHQAYAYLLIPRHAGLLADARKRISAVKQFSTPGSGFKIAMRDLEIRGAGNLLGAEQSGHITAVGFELYCQLLKQSVAALKGEPIPPRVEVQVRIDFLDLAPAAACLPLSYVSEPQHRIELYRRLAQAADPTELTALRAELRDRFGPLPAAADLLFRVAALKRLAAERGITALETREDRLMLTRGGDFIMVGGRFPRLTRRVPQARLNEICKLLLAL